jgi:hypothetical protein
LAGDQTAALLRSKGVKSQNNFALFVNDPNFTKTGSEEMPDPATLAAHGLKPNATRAEWLKARLDRIRKITQFASVGSEIASDAVEQLVKPSSSKKKKFVDQNGNPISPSQWLANNQPGATPQQFAAYGKIASAVGKHLPDLATITAADIAAGEVLDSQGRRKKVKKKATIQGGIQATPGMGGATTTMAAIHETLLEFAQGKERTERAKRIGAIGAAGALGATAGGLAGLAHNSGKPVRHSDLQPGDKVYRRSGPAGMYQHTGVVDESGRVTHRTRGSETVRSVTPDS